MRRGDRADHAVAKACRADAEREVEAAAHVLQCDVVRQLHELAVVEILAEPVEQFVGDAGGVRVMPTA